MTCATSVSSLRFLKNRHSKDNKNQPIVKISENNRKPRVLVLGATGLTGSAIASTLDNEAVDIEVVRAARNKEQVETWKRDGKQAVYLDLDDARTFPAALQGIDKLFLLTGYTIAMLHQSKTIVDAALDSGVNFIVHQGVFGNGRSTEPHFAWHEMIERYIEGSGVAWAHLHPHFFMQNIFTTLGLPNGQLRWPMGDKRMDRRRGFGGSRRQGPD
jgi:uncharacterized protein YbjT (DUF2867 family)